MLLNQIIEGIKMGGSRISSAPKKDYTVGFEFEVAVDRNELSAGEDNLSDFIEEWHEFRRITEFDEWFNNILYHREKRKLLIEEGIEPKYGRPDIIEIAKHEFMIRISKYDSKIIDSAKKFLEDSESEKKYSDEQLVKLVTLFRYFKNGDFYSQLDDYVVSIDSIKSKISVFADKHRKSLDDSKNDIIQHIKEIIKKTIYFNEDDIDRDSYDQEDYIYDKARNIIDIVELTTVDDIIKHFDTDREELEELFEYEWGEFDSEEMMDAFREQSYSNESAISYVASELREIVAEFVIESEESDYSRWTVGTDGTQGVDVEFRSPVLNLERAEQAIDDIFEFIRDDELIETNTRCGLHINIGTWSHDQINEIDWLKFHIISNQRRFLDEFGRLDNDFTTDKLPEIIDILESNNIHDYIDSIPEINNRLFRHSEKYSAINISKLKTHGYIELRSLGGNYEVRDDQVKQYIRMMLHFLDIASDPYAYKKEYVKKLTIITGNNISKQNNKIISPTEFFNKFFQTTDSVRLLSRIHGVIERTITDNIPQHLHRLKEIRSIDYLSEHYSTESRRLLYSILLNPRFINELEETNYISDAEKLLGLIKSRIEQVPRNLFLKDMRTILNKIVNKEYKSNLSNKEQ